MNAVDLRGGEGWLSGEGPDSDVVLSCRARLARNLAGFPFVNRSSSSQRGEVLSLAKRAILDARLDETMLWVELNDATPVDRQLLVDRHLISRQHAEGDLPRAVAVSGDETLSIMVNEEDHLRVQVLRSGLQLRDAFSRVNAVDDAIEEGVSYSFSQRYGYLTACPTNLGTGLRLGVMMHLPALKLTNEIERVRRASKDLHLAVRGFYGEGTESAGDFYQISNQVTLGFTESELMDEFRLRVIPQLIEYERAARRMLVDSKPRLLDDRIHRALGVLGNARLLGVEETMKMLSRVRLGVHLKRVSGIEPAVIDRLCLHIQPAHLQRFAGSEIDGDEQREARATLVRRTLRSN